MSDAGETLAEASRDREELLLVPLAETAGFDARTDYPKYIRPPRAVRVVEKAEAK